MNLITYRKAEEQDFELFYQFEKMIAFNSPSRQKNWNEEVEKITFRTKFKLDNSFIILKDNIPVGSFGYSESTEKLHLLFISISPEFQNKGIGKNIFNELINQSRIKNKKFTLKVFKDSPAVSFYKKLGFIESDDLGSKLLMTYNN